MTTFAEFLPVVLEMRRQDGVRGVRGEINRAHTHIENAAFVTKELADITSLDLRDWLRVMAQKQAKLRRGERRLSTATTKRTYSLVSSVFTVAVERDMIRVSPCLGVKVKKRADESDTREKWAYLKLDEQRALADCSAIPISDRFAIRFAIGTGLRQGEQFNLELSDLHVGVEKPHVMVRYGSPNHLPPKSGKVRKVPLFGDGLIAARQWLYELPTWAPKNPLNLVFPTPRGRIRGVGKPLGNGKEFRRHLDLVGVTRRVTWHSLRHTFASNLVSGVLGRRWTLEEVRPLLGHSSVTVTERYGHLGEDDVLRACEETGRAMGLMPLASATERELPAAPDTAPDLSTWFEQEAS